MLIHCDPNNTNSIVCHLIIVRYSMKTSHWYFSWATTLHLCNMTGRGEKLQQLHCYHLFSNSRDIYLTKNHYENYSPKMVPIAKIWGSGSWTILPMTTINMHMKFEIEIPKQTCLTSRKSCHLQSPETEKSNMAARRPFWKWHCWKSIGSYPYT